MRRPPLQQPTFALTIGGLLALSTALGTLISLSGSALAGMQNDALRQGLPGRRISGGSRSPDTACRTTPNQPVIALVPENNLGLTLAEHPTFWFSLPAISIDRTLEFGLFDPTGEVIYHKTIEASGEAGITHLSLPETSPSLKTNENYRWYLSVVCNPESRSEDLFVTGWIKRVQTTHDINQQLSTASLPERLAIYKESALWYDTLTALVELRRTDPADLELTQQWTTLLESARLTQAIAAPLYDSTEERPPNDKRPEN